MYVKIVCQGLVALGGDRGNTVPLRDITPTELAVLRFIHGDDAVHELTFYELPEGEEERYPLAGEYDRLAEKYPARLNGEKDSKAPVAELFPDRRQGYARSFKELQLSAACLKAERRVEVPDLVDGLPLGDEDDLELVNQHGSSQSTPASMPEPPTEAKATSAKKAKAGASSAEKLLF